MMVTVSVLSGCAVTFRKTTRVNNMPLNVTLAPTPRGSKASADPQSWQLPFKTFRKPRGVAFCHLVVGEGLSRRAGPLPRPNLQVPKDHSM